MLKKNKKNKKQTKLRFTHAIFIISVMVFMGIITKVILEDSVLVSIILINLFLAFAIAEKIMNIFNLTFKEV